MINSPSSRRNITFNTLAFDLKNKEIGKFISGRPSGIISPRNNENSIQDAKSSRKKAIEDIIFKEDIAALEEQFDRLMNRAKVRQQQAGRTNKGATGLNLNSQPSDARYELCSSSFASTSNMLGPF